MLLPLFSYINAELPGTVLGLITSTLSLYHEADREIFCGAGPDDWQRNNKYVCCLPSLPWADIIDCAVRPGRIDYWQRKNKYVCLPLTMSRYIVGWRGYRIGTELTLNKTLDCHCLRLILRLMVLGGSPGGRGNYPRTWTVSVGRRMDWGSYYLPPSVRFMVRFMADVRLPFFNWTEPSNLEWACFDW